ncbi:hypothetical protein QFC22_004757 [Naganishia vaughanmartiniae]|uniref:Uncharacterized protein n=1 Tax=Naganishia vaughanmartiniae TaxID=1424756 RepID=A0ACC2WXD9_9TREE|nr:hypothetical protein QFC22_004757 [Naganishia vaughanmartiniae]
MDVDQTKTLFSIPIEVLQIVFNCLQVDRQFKSLANLNICCKLLAEGTLPYLYKEVHWKDADCKMYKEMLDDKVIPKGWKHIQYLFLHDQADNYKGLPHSMIDSIIDMNRQLNQSVDLSLDQLCHTFFPRIIFKAGRTSPGAVASGYCPATHGTWSDTLSMRNATMNNSDMVRTLLDGIQVAGWSKKKFSKAERGSKKERPSWQQCLSDTELQPKMTYKQPQVDWKTYSDQSPCAGRMEREGDAGKVVENLADSSSLDNGRGNEDKPQGGEVEAASDVPVRQFPTKDLLELGPSVQSDQQAHPFTTSEDEGDEHRNIDSDMNGKSNDYDNDDEDNIGDDNDEVDSTFAGDHSLFLLVKSSPDNTLLVEVPGFVDLNLTFAISKDNKDPLVCRIIPVYQLYAAFKAVSGVVAEESSAEGMCLKISGQSVTHSMRVWIDTLLNCLDDGTLLPCPSGGRLIFDDCRDPIDEPDDFVDSLCEVQSMILRRVTTEEKLAMLPGEICLFSGRCDDSYLDGNEEEYGGEEQPDFVRGNVNLTSLERAKYVRSGIQMRNCIDLWPARVFENGEELIGDERRKAEKLLGAKIIL